MSIARPIRARCGAEVRDRAMIIVFSTVVHLAKRFVGMLSRRPLARADVVWVDSVLLDRESALWRQLSLPDQRHSIVVARRFVAEVGDRCRDDIAAALLHDIGKLRSGLGVWSRVLATVVGPRTERFRRYHDHEQIGAEMLRSAGSTERTIGLIDGTSTDQLAVEALLRADDI